jgi:hypothetical protein
MYLMKGSQFFFCFEIGIVMTSGQHALLCCDISPDGHTIAAGSDLNGEDASIFYWYDVS